MFRINHAILHVFDFTSCVNIFSQAELDLESKQIKSYITKHVRKGLTHIDNKRGEFSADSSFAPELRAYFNGERDFVALSVQIAEFISSELGRMSKAESTDLLVVDFEEETKLEGGNADAAEIEASFAGRVNRYFGIFMLESRQAFMHSVGYGENGEHAMLLSATMLFFRALPRKSLLLRLLMSARLRLLSKIRSALLLVRIVI